MAERRVVGAVSELLHVFVIGADPVPVVNGRLAGGALAPLVRGGKPEGGESPVLAEPGDGTEHLVARDAVDLLSHLVPSPVDLPSNRRIRPAGDARQPALFRPIVRRVADGESDMSWEMVDEGWGRRAVDFSTLSEPANCREYIAVHQRLRVGPGIRLLDMACGSGLAIELARIQGATCAGIDASPRLVAVARDRSPDCDIRVGDMQATPWADASFDVVTSFRGLWGTTPAAVDEARRLLVTGGRLAMTVWGNVGKSPGGWLLAPFLWATDEKIQHQADMVALGRPGIGEAFLGERGFEVEARFEVPFAMEYPDPETYARAIAATGPAYEAIQSIGEEEFATRAAALAAEHMRDGVPLRGEIQVFGYVGTKR